MHNKLLLYPAGETSAVRFAAIHLKRFGIPLIDHPSPEVTHLLLDIPSFQVDGCLRGGKDISSILEQLPSETVILGGYLDHPALHGYLCIDLLKDQTYQALNAGITAQCTAQYAMNQMTRTLDSLPVLILGWGRIGKCLSSLLKNMGARVTVAARKEADRSILQALGYCTLSFEDLGKHLTEYRMIVNTIPAPTLTPEQLEQCHSCTKIDLASAKALPGEDVFWAKGLPNTYAPESSGILIAETTIRLIRENAL